MNEPNFVGEYGRPAKRERAKREREQADLTRREEAERAFTGEQDAVIEAAQMADERGDAYIPETDR